MTIFGIFDQLLSARKGKGITEKVAFFCDFQTLWVVQEEKRW